MRCTAQSTSERAAATCPQPHQVLPVHLYGVWQAEVEGAARLATVLFERHPELKGSVRGGVNRDGVRAFVAGDVDDEGEFTLDESADGRAIDAVWEGRVAEGSCGKEIRGVRRDAKSGDKRAFVLRKLPGW